LKGRKHTPEQIIRKLREADRLLGEGKSSAEVAVKALEVTEWTRSRWRNQYGGLKGDDAKRLKELEKENARLNASSPTRPWTTTCSGRLPGGNSEPAAPAGRGDDVPCNGQRGFFLASTIKEESTRVSSPRSSG
jgi:hypothetical protein